MTSNDDKLTGDTFEPLLDEDQAGALLGLSVSTLQKKRLTGDGPPFVRLGPAVRYRPAALRDFIAACEVRSTSETPRAA